EPLFSLTPVASNTRIAKMKIFSFLVVLCLACLSLALPQPLAQQQGKQGDQRHFFGGLYNNGLYNNYGGLYGGHYGGHYGGYNSYGGLGGYGGYGYGGYNPIWG
ncbi:unnamed protein product, partial [Meganyctiphanes norvegica]